MFGKLRKSLYLFYDNNQTALYSYNKKHIIVIDNRNDKEQQMRDFEEMVKRIVIPDINDIHKGD